MNHFVYIPGALQRQLFAAPNGQESQDMLA